jgi:hypothetical protein
MSIETNPPLNGKWDAGGSEWISTKDRLPESGINVLTYGEYDFVIAYRDPIYEIWEPTWGDRETGTPYLTDNNVTHWQPLLAPPITK